MLCARSAAKVGIPVTPGCSAMAGSAPFPFWGMPLPCAEAILGVSGQDTAGAPAWRWSGRLAGLLAFIARRDPGELARRLGGAAVKGSLDHREYRAMQRGGQQDHPPPLLLVGGLRRVISPADDLPDLLEDQAGEQAAQRAGDQVHLLVQQLDHRLPPALAVSRGYLSKGGSGYSGGDTVVFCCHGQRPVSSTSSEKLRNVRIKTMMPSAATLVRVGWPATVWTMSPATSSSRPSRMVWPSCWRKRR